MARRARKAARRAQWEAEAAGIVPAQGTAAEPSGPPSSPQPAAMPSLSELDPEPAPPPRVAEEQQLALDVDVDPHRNRAES